MRHLPYLLACLIATVVLHAADRHVILITIDGFPAYLFQDQQASIPTLRRLASDGTIAEGMHVSNPAVTWPNHTTLVTGVHPSRHSVLFNGVLVRGGDGLPVKVEPRSDQAALIAVPTLFEHLRAAGLNSAAINWPCTRNSPSLADNFPDVPENVTHSTPRLIQELIALGSLKSTNETEFRALSGPARDQIWTDAACLALKHRRPAFLALHLLNTDGIHHRYGAQSPASYTAIALADMYVRQLVDTLKSEGMWSATTLIITSDHGFATASRTVQPNVALRKAGLLQTSTPLEVVKARAQVVPEGGIGMVYLTNPATREEDRRAVIELFRNLEGVETVLEPETFAALGLPIPETASIGGSETDRARRGMADLILVAKEGYNISGSPAGDEAVIAVAGAANLGHHGVLTTDSRMVAAFIATGRGIKRGHKIGFVRNIDVAPTAAALLGQPFSGVDGQVIEDMLTRQ